GVLAIILTIMVLELQPPHNVSLRALITILPVFFSYVLSFVYVGIYWNNHHHLIQTANQVNAPILWANLHLLFWLSLIPFATGWMGEHHKAGVPAALYGLVLLMAAIAYAILQYGIIKTEGDGSVLSQAVGTDIKGKLSIVLYAAGIALSFLRPWMGQVLYLAVALMWLLPDGRIEKKLVEEGVEAE
ncbi:MAG: hypothetical protein JWM96_822, partial [Alphaproteobacteria bacterium]|nr:hypothetical protein [Alphaproteobacteria bacterium]